MPQVTLSRGQRGTGRLGRLLCEDDELQGGVSLHRLALPQQDRRLFVGLGRWVWWSAGTTGPPRVSLCHVEVECFSLRRAANACSDNLFMPDTRCTSGQAVNSPGRYATAAAILSNGTLSAQGLSQWLRDACPVEEAAHACFYAGDSRAASLARLAFPDATNACTSQNLSIPDALLHGRRRRLVFIGDSLSRQHFVVVACSLRRHISKADLTWYVPQHRMSPGQPGECPASSGSTREAVFTRELPTAHCRLERRGCVHTTFGLTLCTDGGNRPDLISNSLDDWLLTDAMIVLNFGQHVNDPAEYSSLLANWTARIASAHSTTRHVSKATLPPLVIWRETTPTHFNTSDGQWTGHETSDGSCQPSASSYCCVSLTTERRRRQRWRNEMANAAFTAAGVPIMRVYERLAARWEAHVGWPHREDALMTDCMHWCLPGALDAWDSQLWRLLGRLLGAEPHVGEGLPESRTFRT